MIPAMSGNAGGDDNDEISSNPLKALKAFFSYDAFRTYNGKSLQEDAIGSALAGESLITIFPTGGGKSVTFQLPALMAWRADRALTIVLSPLQSLMKDQVDNLSRHHITQAVAINGLINPIERSDAIKRIEEGDVALLYVSPEQLRSGTLVRLLLKRTIARVVIDEAHCFSAWGHDFRVDYLYIGKFLQELQKSKCLSRSIPVSCFTATAKQQVINEISEYFHSHCGLSLKLFRADVERSNLHYHVTPCADEKEKYVNLKRIISANPCPAIIYVSRTGRAEKLAEKLSQDGIPACPFHGQMSSVDKIRNQDAFIKNETPVMVATSAFGMGVDKKDIGLVIHHDISSSLEAYLQESGRAGRDPSLQADCHILYNENDLNEHFSLYSNSQITISDINRVWRKIEKMTPNAEPATCSAYEIARSAGWISPDKQRVNEVETRVRVCISALEQAGYLVRERNVPMSLANSLQETDLQKVSQIISDSKSLNEEERAVCFRIMSHLIIAHKKKNEISHDDANALTQVDQLSCKLSLTKKEMYHHINLLRDVDLLSDDLDMTAVIRPNVVLGNLTADLRRFENLEKHVISQLSPGTLIYQLDEINESATNIAYCEVGIHHIRTLLDFHASRNDLKISGCLNSHAMEITSNVSRHVILDKIHKRYGLCEFIVNQLCSAHSLPSPKELTIHFSVVGLAKSYRKIHSEACNHDVTQSEIEDALLFMNQIEMFNLSGGFLVGCNRMRIKRKVRNQKAEYTERDYEPFRTYYRQKNESVHIVGEYARLMLEDRNLAKAFVRDYFDLDLEDFIEKHFKGLHAKEIRRALTPNKYAALFGDLSEVQRSVTDDVNSQIQVIASSPGCGKTKVLVAKLASLILLENVSQDKLLVLTFSSNRILSFKTRLRTILGQLSGKIEIKTFHSFSLEILGIIGGKDRQEWNVACAAEMIQRGNTELDRITKSVLLIDDAENMNKDEYALVRALMDCNPHMRVIIAGDDDRAIAKFRGSNADYFRKLAKLKSATKHELTESYRSSPDIVNFRNAYLSSFKNRLKTKPLQSLNNQVGRIEIVEYVSENMEQSLAEQLIANESHNFGTCAVLTQTNEEASIITAILLKHGIRAKLIHSDDQIQLRNLLEIRYFIGLLKKASQSGGEISPSEWRSAWEMLFVKYSTSTVLPLCRAILKKFGEMVNMTVSVSEDCDVLHPAMHNGNTNFRLTDFEKFLNESSIEDFQESVQNTVVVSTLYKAKGRSFDSVYMLVKNFDFNPWENRRLLYVGFACANQNLFIHCNAKNMSFFKDVVTSYKVNDKGNLSRPEALSFMLTHHDVNLSYFSNYKKEILSLRSGMSVTINNESIYAETSSGFLPICRFSQAFQKKMHWLCQNGYVPGNARIVYILAWRPRDSPSEIAIILPFITFSRKRTIENNC